MARLDVFEALQGELDRIALCVHTGGNEGGN